MGLKSFRRKIRKTPPSVLLTTGFLSIILTGTALLLLPVSTTSGISITDAFFVATSAVIALKSMLSIRSMSSRPRIGPY